MLDDSLSSLSTEFSQVFHILIVPKSSHAANLISGRSVSFIFDHFRCVIVFLPFSNAFFN